MAPELVEVALDEVEDEAVEEAAAAALLLEVVAAFCGTALERPKRAVAARR